MTFLNNAVNKILGRNNAAALNAERKAKVKELSPEEQDAKVDEYVEVPKPVVEAKSPEGPKTAEQASAMLDKWEFTPYASALLDRAVANVQANDGSRFTIEQGRDRFKNQSDLLKNAGGNLSVAVMALYEVGAEPGTVYSLLYNVMKAALFIGNMDYRRALDPRADDDLDERADTREDHRDPPPGMQRDPLETDGVHTPSTGGRTYTTANGLRVTDYAAIVQSIEQINLFLDLLSKSFGWPIEQCMPYCTVPHPNGTYDPVYSVDHALDITEVNRQKSRAKREERRAKDISAGSKRATEILLRMAQTKAPHQE